LFKVLSTQKIKLLAAQEKGFINDEPRKKDEDAEGRERERKC
jgi:hypothetical protein